MNFSLKLHKPYGVHFVATPKGMFIGLLKANRLFE